MSDGDLLVYDPDDGFAWVRIGDGPKDDNGFTLETEACPTSKHPSLAAAFIEAVKRGANPTHWMQPDWTRPITDDQADHWRAMANQEAAP